MFNHMTSQAGDRRPSDVPDPWANSVRNGNRGGPAYAAFVRSFRDLQDAIACSNPPEDVWTQAEVLAAGLFERLGPWTVPEGAQPAGTRMDLPGRGHPFLLPFVPEESTDRSIQGRVVFRRFHLGGGGAAHGGALPLFFDEILGRLANAGERPRARTAYLTVNYRHITPIEVELTAEATLDRQEGRKRWISGRLYDGQTLLADAEGLFVELRPGQP